MAQKTLPPRPTVCLHRAAAGRCASAPSGRFTRMTLPSAAVDGSTESTTPMENAPRGCERPAPASKRLSRCWIRHSRPWASIPNLSEATAKASRVSPRNSRRSVRLEMGLKRLGKRLPRAWGRSRLPIGAPTHTRVGNTVGSRTGEPGGTPAAVAACAHVTCLHVPAGWGGPLATSLAWLPLSSVFGHLTHHLCVYHHRKSNRRTSSNGQHYRSCSRTRVDVSPDRVPNLV